MKLTFQLSTLVMHITANSLLVFTYFHLHCFSAAIATGTVVEFHNDLHHPIELVAGKFSVASRQITRIQSGQ